MDDLIFNRLGWTGFFLYIIIQNVPKLYKMWRGTYVSCRQLDIKIVELKGELSKVQDLVPILQQHLKDSTDRVADLAVLKRDNELNNEYIREGNKEIREDIKNIYKMISDIKNMMINRSN